jgi:SSS family solute:Na+ symporter
MGTIDLLVLVGFVVCVVAVGLLKSRKEKTSEDYFLAGRGLMWPLVGFSLIAANISTEQFVGMSGKAADWLGMAIASYEWMAAITLVVVAFVFLPKFLKSGIFTIPEFLEYRYNSFARTLMAISTLVILVGVPTASVIFSGAKVVTVFFQGETLLGLPLSDMTVGCWIIGVLATAYVLTGGLKACAWADLIQGAALIIGGAVLAYFAFNALGDADPSTLKSWVSNPDTAALSDAGAVERFKILNGGALEEGGKLHMIRDIKDPEIPWTVLILGLWIPNFFYWGLNQYITQRTLGSKSLDQGQRGVVFAAFLKLLIPFLVVIPGIMAFNLFSGDLGHEANAKNSKAVAMYSPEFYEKLSDSFKPDPAWVGGKQDIEDVNKELDEPENYERDKVTLFVITEPFVIAHPRDAFLIADYNLRHAKTVLPDVEETVVPADIEKLLEFNNKNIVKRVTDEDDERFASQKLVGHDYDAAFPTLLRKLLPYGKGIQGFVLAAIFGAVISSLASMLNSASTIATMDLFRKIKKDASQGALVLAGRCFVVLFVLIALSIAPNLGDPKFGGIFTYIQEFQGFISPGVLAVFLFGLLVHKAPRACGLVGLMLNPILYGVLKWWVGPALCSAGLWFSPEMSFLDRMAVCFLLIMAVLTVMTIVNPLKKPVDLPVNEKMDMTASSSTKIFGAVVVALTLVLYVIFF